MKCKPYSEITVEIRTQLKTVKITSNIFAVQLKIPNFPNYVLFQLQDKSGPKPRPAARQFQPWTFPALELKTSPALRCQDKSSPKTIQDKSSPETSPALRHVKTSPALRQVRTSLALRQVQP